MPQRVELLNGALDTRSATTQNRRPLRELDAYPKTIDRARRSGVKFETVDCTYDDTRKGLKMNKSALDDVASRWRPLHANLAYLGHAYFGGNPPEQLTARQVHDIACLGTILPAYFFNRAIDQVGKVGRLPNEVGDVFKVLQGLISPAAFIITDSGNNAVIATGRQMYEVVHEKALSGDNKFKGTDNRVCPAPPDMITNAGNVFLMKTDVDIRQASLAGMIPDFEVVKKFAELAANYEDRHRRYEPYFEKVAGLWRKASTPSVSANYLEQFRGQRDVFIEDITPIQAEMNRVLGHRSNLEVPPSPFDLERLFGLRT